MSGEAPFLFRKFQLQHGSGSWKVGTDSVLLGSWCRIEGATTALDLGTGSGIMALMLAQRNARLVIDAIEILPEACELARLNIDKSEWKDRITLLQGDVMSSSSEQPLGSYDTIVCNPPYFPLGQSSVSETRKASRQGIGFSIWDVARIAKQHLHPGGTLHIVVPAQVVYDFIEQANENKLFVHRKLEVKHHPNAGISLVLLELSDTTAKPVNESLVLYMDSKPSEGYRKLCENFMLFERAHEASSE